MNLKDKNDKTLKTGDYIYVNPNILSPVSKSSYYEIIRQTPKADIYENGRRYIVATGVGTHNGHIFHFFPKDVEKISKNKERREQFLFLKKLES